METADFSLLADFRAADNQQKKREQLALEMIGYDGFLNRMLTPEERKHARHELTNEEIAAHERWQADLDDTQRMIAERLEAAQRAVEVTERQLKEAKAALEDVRRRHLGRAPESGSSRRRSGNQAKSYAERTAYYARRAQNGDVTAQELADMRVDLDAMPPAVRDRMTGGHPIQRHRHQPD